MIRDDAVTRIRHLVLRCFAAGRQLVVGLFFGGVMIGLQFELGFG